MVGKLPDTSFRQFVGIVVLLFGEAVRNDLLESSDKELGIQGIFVLHRVHERVQKLDDGKGGTAVHGVGGHIHRSKKELDHVGQEKGREHRLDVVAAAVVAVAVVVVVDRVAAAAIASVLVGAVTENHGTGR